MAPLPVLAEGFRHRAVGLGQLGHDNGLGYEIGAGATQIFGHGEGAKAQFGTGFDDVPIPRLATAFDLIALE